MNDWGFKVYAKRISRVLAFLVCLIIFSSCSRDITHEGKVNHYYSILVQPPYKVMAPSYDWIIHEFPENSQLSFSDLLISSSGNELTFLPDVTGDYIFEVVVFDGNKQAGSKKYVFNISSPEIVESPVPEIPDLEVIEPESIEITEQPKEDLVDTLEILSANSEQFEPEAITTEIESVPEETTLTEIPSADENAETVIEPPVEPITSVETKLEKETPSTLTRGQHYTIQISAWPILEKAEAVVDTLEDLGFDTYIQKGYLDNNDAIWYRVRVGTFSTMTEAKNASNAIQSITKYDTWIDRVREDL